MAMQVKSNTPSVGFIQWTGVSIAYKGTTYAITDGNTNNAYVYWLLSSPTSFQVSNTYPSSLGIDDILVFVNKFGAALTVPNTTVLDGSLIVPQSITANAIAADTITALQIAANAITSSELAAGSVTANALAANSVAATNIIAGAVSTNALAANAVTAANIAAGAVGANQIAANSITTAKLNVTDLSAITTNLGSITTGSIQLPNVINANETDNISMTALGLQTHTTITSAPNTTEYFAMLQQGFLWLQEKYNGTLQHEMSYDDYSIQYTEDLTPVRTNLKSTAIWFDSTNGINFGYSPNANLAPASFNKAMSLSDILLTLNVPLVLPTPAWTNATYTNGFSSYDTRVVKYASIAGKGAITGVCKNTSLSTLPIFTLPANIRPSYNYATLVSAKNDVVEVTVKTDGTVQVTNWRSAAFDFIHLNIVFPIN
jgi:hypothetical protein